MQMGPCNDAATKWAHDAVTGQLRATVKTKTGTTDVQGQEQEQLCLDWKDHALQCVQYRRSCRTKHCVVYQDTLRAALGILTLDFRLIH